MQTFYNGLTHAMRGTTNVMAEGTLMRKTVDNAYNLIDKMALNNY